MRRLVIAALALAGCSTQPQYQGNVILGSFQFSAAAPTADTCELVDGGFAFTGVLSYDTTQQVLYLDTDGVTADDHTGTLSGRHFVLHGAALRSVDSAINDCPNDVTVDETLEGDLFEQTDAGTDCSLLEADGGPLDWPVPGDGGAGSFVAIAACGTLGDVSEVVDGGCPTSCTLQYPLSGVPQGSSS